MYKQLSTIALFALGAKAATNITETVNGIIPNSCKSDCQQWVSSVGDCITNLNETFSASINTGNLSSWQFSGNLSDIASCLCAATAVQSSQTCLSCASDNLCISPAFSMQDYSMVCNNPMYALQIFKRYHPNIGAGSCSASSSSSVSGSSTSTSSSASSGPSTTSSSVSGSSTSSSASSSPSSSSSSNGQLGASSPSSSSSSSMSNGMGSGCGDNAASGSGSGSASGISARTRGPYRRSY
ncbi:unnamed protein product [Sphagnum tenellum]